MRTVVIGDIHGCYNELVALITMLQECGKYDANNDKLVFLGDYIDRGADSDKVIKYIRELQENNKNVIALMGNHEDMMIKSLDSEYEMRGWEYNGGNMTMMSYGWDKEQFKDDVEWAKNLPLYHEDEHFIYVHAGVDVNKPMNEQNRHDLLWIREAFIYNAKQYDKTVIFGHTPMCGSNPYYTPANHICIDTACVFNGCLTALVVEDGEIDDFYQVANSNNNKAEKKNKKSKSKNKKSN